MSAKFLGKKFPGAFVIGALALAAGVLFAMPGKPAHADVFSPGFVKEMISSARSTPGMILLRHS